MRPTWLVVIAAGIVSCGSGYGDGERVGTSALPITGGSADAADPAVVQLRGGVGTCTGTLIAADVVLTAAHCLGPPWPTEVVFGPGQGSEDQTVPIDDCVAHPKFNRETVTDDIGLVHLARPIPVPPIRVSTEPLTRASIGRDVRIVGYGSNGTFDGVHDKRQGDAIVTAIAATTFTIAPGPALTCVGDSGGPALVDSDGEQLVVGVTSMGDLLCRSTGVDTRVDTYVDTFIEPYLRAVDGGASKGCAAADAPRLSGSDGGWKAMLWVGVVVIARRRGRNGSTSRATFACEAGVCRGGPSC